MSVTASYKGRLPTTVITFLMILVFYKFSPIRVVEAGVLLLILLLIGVTALCPLRCLSRSRQPVSQGICLLAIWHAALLHLTLLQGSRICLYLHNMMAFAYDYFFFTSICQKGEGVGASVL